MVVLNMQWNSVSNTVFHICILPLFSIQALLSNFLRSMARSSLPLLRELNTPFKAKWVSGMKIVQLLMLPYYSVMVGTLLSLSVLLLCNNNCRFCTFSVHINFEVSSLQAFPLSALISLVLIWLAHFLLLQLTMHIQKQYPLSQHSLLQSSLQLARHNTQRGH